MIRQATFSQAVATILAAASVAVTVGLSSSSAEAATCTGRDVRSTKTETYVPGAGYFWDVKMTKCSAQRMAEAWGNASGAAGAAGTVIGLFNGWTGFSGCCLSFPVAHFRVAE